MHAQRSRGHPRSLPRPNQEITLAQAEQETGLRHRSLVAAISRGRLAATLVADSKHVPMGVGTVYVVERQELEAYLAGRKKGNVRRVHPDFVWSRPDLETQYYRWLMQESGEEEIGAILE